MLDHLLINFPSVLICDLDFAPPSILTVNASPPLLIVTAVAVYILSKLGFILFIPQFGSVSDPLPPDFGSSSRRQLISPASTLLVRYIQFPAGNQSISTTRVQDTSGRLMILQDSRGIENQR
jgi:hypothetical protein